MHLAGWRRCLLACLDRAVLCSAPGFSPKTKRSLEHCLSGNYEAVPIPGLGVPAHEVQLYDCG